MKTSAMKVMSPGHASLSLSRDDCVFILHRDSWRAWASSLVVDSCRGLIPGSGCWPGSLSELILAGISDDAGGWVLLPMMVP